MKDRTIIALVGIVLIGSLISLAMIGCIIQSDLEQMIIALGMGLAPIGIIVGYFFGRNSNG